MECNSFIPGNAPPNLIGFVNGSPPSTSGGGGGGGLIVETGSYTAPQVVSSLVVVPLDDRSRIFVESTGGPITANLADGAGVQELFIVGVSDADTVELDSGANLILSGAIVFGNKTLLSLQWIESLSSWVEVSRNEVF